MVLLTVLERMLSEVLKYHRVQVNRLQVMHCSVKVTNYHSNYEQESLPDIFKTDKITAASIELNSIVVGTEDGFVHVLSFTGKLLKSIKAHDRPVNAISVDGSGHTIARLSIVLLLFLS